MIATRGSWLVLRVRNVDQARANVRNQSCEFYAPSALVRSARTGRLSPRPLFPGYAFARPAGEQWSFLCGTRGVSGVLMATGIVPCRCSDAEVDALRSREGPDGLVVMGQPEFRPGEAVRVRAGPALVDAVVEGMLGPDRVAVLLRVLGGVRAEVEVGRIERP